MEASIIKTEFISVTGIAVIWAYAFIGAASRSTSVNRVWRTIITILIHTAIILPYRMNASVIKAEFMSVAWITIVWAVQVAGARISSRDYDQG